MHSSVLELAIGVITSFAGGLGNIPPHWQLCDGTNGTPDLRNQFVVAAGPIMSVGSTGGIGWVGHTFTGDGHSHALPGGANVVAGGAYNDASGSGAATGLTGGVLPRPPYYALAYIMYLGE